MANPYRSTTGRMALGGLLTAGGVVMLYLACLAPSGRMAVAGIAGLFPMVARLVAGRWTGYVVWGATSVLGFFLAPDKAIALLFSVIVGLYPVVKVDIEQYCAKAVGWLCKFIYCALGLALLERLLLSLMLRNPPQWVGDAGLLIYPLGFVIFLIYDLGLSRVARLLVGRLSRGYKG